MSDDYRHNVSVNPTTGYWQEMNQINMSPEPGARVLRFVGDRVRFEIHSAAPLKGIRAFLRTTLGQDAVLRRRAMTPMTGERIIPGADWRNIPMQTDNGHLWWVECTLTEPGFFWAKSYFAEGNGQTHWPEGENVGISVHPAALRSGNTIYCAFPRLFGETRFLKSSRGGLIADQLRAFDDHGFTVIPPSGTLRDLTRQLPHIIQRLGCRILHLLPVNPTPTVYARMGRYGSPYASLDLTGIDPSLVVFDKHTTGVDQFCELTRETHHLGGRVMLDVVINHTGWSSNLHENRPEWFVRSPNGEFKSPGAWGVVWGDLVEMDQEHVELWSYIAESFLTWCRRGVDGFRCDAGYMIPMRTWNAITARVREEFPETIFLLEGLGGPWSATETLLTQGRMQWAYSELFQNFDGPSVASYNDHSIAQNSRVGVLVHYSETHDNARLAEKGRTWSLLRNRLCALASHSGAFGFTCGVEWLATEKIDVHECCGLNWDADENIVSELAELNNLLQSHPCFHEDAVCRRVSYSDDAVYVLERRREDLPPHPLRILVIANTDLQREHQIVLEPAMANALGRSPCDLLRQIPPFMRTSDSAELYLTIPAGAVYCLAEKEYDSEETGQRYRNRRNRHALAIQALATRFFPEEIGACNWRDLAALVNRNPRSFLGAVMRISRAELADNPVIALREKMVEESWDEVAVWRVSDQHRIMPVPAGHWLLVHHSDPFRILFKGHPRPIHQASIHISDGHIAVLPPDSMYGDAELEIDSHHLSTSGGDSRQGDGYVRGRVRFLSSKPDVEYLNQKDGVMLLTNGRGGMARMQADFSTVRSKYDCVLGINSHPEWPVDRHVLVKRVRAWVVSDGFSQPIDLVNLDRVIPGTPARWEFTTGACGGFSIELSIEATMLPLRNATLMRFHRGRIGHATGQNFPRDGHMDLIIRVDLESRSFHQDTFFSPGADDYYRNAVSANPDGKGFTFRYSHEQPLHVFVREGLYLEGPEWCTHIGHPIDAERGQHGSGDCYSPGWFKVDMRHLDTCILVMDADAFGMGSNEPVPARVAENAFERKNREVPGLHLDDESPDPFGDMLARASAAFVVKRETGKTVIAGYPWFLDWGRDTLICARGLISMGYHAEVEEILTVFGKFVDNGTLPNCIHGADVSNRDTTDAPLWYNIVVEELAAHMSTDFLQVEGRFFTTVIENIATGYLHGTYNGIGMDWDSGLIYSPPHFTWMDTNFPAGTPREGYPVEIQVLWIRLLDHLVRLNVPSPGNSPTWGELAALARRSLTELYWDEEKGYLADCILAERRTKARDGIKDMTLRSNALFAVSLDILTGERARRTVLAALRHLVIPGAIRSLAPLEVDTPLPIYGRGGHLLNNPRFPYFGHYAGDEDTSRKPAYHNGTAWTWPFPSFCEALAKAWQCQDAAVQSAASYLSSMDALLKRGCLGHLPEILDGNVPHTQRGCDAQAWGATEALRVWRWLQAEKARIR